MDTHQHPSQPSITTVTTLPYHHISHAQWSPHSIRICTTQIHLILQCSSAKNIVDFNAYNYAEGQICPPEIKVVIILELNVIFASSCKFKFVCCLEIYSKKLSIWTMERPRKALTNKGLLKWVSQGKEQRKRIFDKRKPKPKLRFVFRFLLNQNRKLDFLFGFGLAEIPFLPEILAEILFEV